ncbi:GAF and ANTAR domain-containing protein [Streptomyces cavernae]|uniref:GAF and ANTAR domain-containing protein n=1 Tax=Streptomyces cavernae TaxID=2259034 RepID=UPI000FEBDD57|nr:ANTAR domain-containing protein [Streptomyces cavernae]
MAENPARHDENDPTSSGGALHPSERDDLRREIERLRREVRELRGKARSHPLISQAQGILQERYRLPDADVAFLLMRGSSQRHNVKLRSLAAAVVSAPRPEAGAQQWFPRRARRPSPTLRFLPGTRPDRLHRSTVLRTVLASALAVTDTEMGNLQLVDQGLGGLRLEEQRGFSAEFLDFFALVDDKRTTCALAAERGVRVTSEIATEPVFSEPAREVILATGSRVAHSVPMMGGSGHCVGVFSLHQPGPLRDLTDSQARQLEGIAAQAGRWLEWHQRTVVLDALEDLHREASAPR